ncbi:esterase-like activity of phytase family protein [Actinoplanes sp. TRM 88003]|uniref:Esterase-like activity of phytase family protein n=1 Tax=Paractinoplanes aksuensis TaxID=2939490 RepID=A0ABT1E3W2_9ACTN|nr:esterase-like activity of phytase family protein [Actinoplanes aksuensis]MCO8277812.1 esterase-like activity of phytase family protein [Actinoplanes aksuensis]
MKVAYTLRGRLMGPAVAAGVLVPLLAVPAAHAAAAPSGGNCSPQAEAVSYSDSLDKTTTADGVAVGGLSAIAYDRFSRSYATVVDRSGTQPARLVFLSTGRTPRATATTLLKRADGTAYDGTNFDGEGLAVLPNGNFLISSEAEPSIRIFGRDGVQRGELPVPDRFRVAPTGEAVENATLESLTISPDGKYVYAAMEGSLAGDAPADGTVARHRVLVYRNDGRGGYRLARQFGYQADRGNRIAEVTAYGDGRLLFLEAAFTSGVGNTVRLYAVSGVNRAPDVSAVPNLSTVSYRNLAGKQPVADLANCPTLGATSPQPQLNPLLDNFEGLAVEPGAHGARHRLRLISDDNFNANQKTRVLLMDTRLP